MSDKLKAISCKLPIRVARFGRRPVSGAYRLKLTAFTLLEVVVAVGIFAIGMVAVIGLFSPVAKSVTASADAEAATHLADLLIGKLQADERADELAGTPFKTITARMKVSAGKTHQLTDADAKTNYNIATDPQLLFANRDGTIIAPYADKATWVNGDRDKYFEIALIRNESISPNDATLDATAPMLAYTARVRWPAFVSLAGVANNASPNSVQVGANPTGTVAFDHSQKQVLFFSGAITR
jgi:type II secretory pathway pseudopilin PulG